MWFLMLMIQLRSGTQTARLSGASFCICKQQPEFLRVSPTIVNQMKRSPYIHFKLKPLSRYSPSLDKACFCTEWDAICSQIGNLWLQPDEHSSSGDKAVLPPLASAFGRQDYSAELLTVKTEYVKRKSCAPQKNKRQAPLNAEFIGSSMLHFTILQCHNKLHTFKTGESYIRVRLYYLKSPQVIVTLQKLLVEALGQNT